MTENIRSERRGQKNDEAMVRLVWALDVRGGVGLMFRRARISLYPSPRLSESTILEPNRFELCEVPKQ